MLGRLNHVAIAVPDLAAATASYRDTLGARVSAPQPLPEHGVTVVFVELDNTKVELLEPLGENSPIAAFLEKSPSGGMHHICYEVADIIAETSGVARDAITPQSHTIDDLGIDSLDFLDIVFAIDRSFGIKIPLERWTQDINDGRASTKEYFVIGNLCAKIDSLVASKAA